MESKIILVKGAEYTPYPKLKIAIGRINKIKLLGDKTENNTVISTEIKLIANPIDIHFWDEVKLESLRKVNVPSIKDKKIGI